MAQTTSPIDQMPAVDLFMAQRHSMRLGSAYSVDPCRREELEEKLEQEMSYIGGWAEIEAGDAPHVAEPLSKVERLGLELGRIQCLVRYNTQLSRGDYIRFCTGSDLDGRATFMELRVLRVIKADLGYAAAHFHQLFGYDTPEKFIEVQTSKWHSWNPRLDVDLVWLVDP